MLKKLRDYSGEFLPELKLEYFSSDARLELLKLSSRLYIGLDGFWYFAVQEKFGNDEALACDIKAWERTAKYEMAKLTKQLNIQGNDVVALMKALQLTPWYWTIKSRIEIENQISAVLTVTYCPTLNALEKEGEGRESQICDEVEHKVFKAYASFFSPDVEIKCLKSPLGRSKDDICCQWRFKLGS
ncbi:DUF6125 family protein [Chloroflexota bacterium]